MSAVRRVHEDGGAADRRRGLDRGAADEQPGCPRTRRRGPAGEDGDAAVRIHDDLRKWYVIHTYSGYENKVKTNLEHRIESMGVQDKIFQVVIPTEEEIEIKDGQRRTVQTKVFPGYVLVEMAMDDDAWYVVRNTPGVTGFVGTGTRPIAAARTTKSRRSSSR